MNGIFVRLFGCIWIQIIVCKDCLAASAREAFMHVYAECVHLYTRAYASFIHIYDRPASNTSEACMYMQNVCIYKYIHTYLAHKPANLSQSAHPPNSSHTLKCQHHSDSSQYVYVYIHTYICRQTSGKRATQRAVDVPRNVNFKQLIHTHIHTYTDKPLANEPPSEQSISPAMSISSNSDASQDWQQQQLGGMKRRRGPPEIARLSVQSLDPRLPPSEEEILHQRMAMAGMAAKDLIDHPLSRHCENMYICMCVCSMCVFCVVVKNRLCVNDTMLCMHGPYSICAYTYTHMNIHAHVYATYICIYKTTLSKSTLSWALTVLVRAMNTHTIFSITFETLWAISDATWQSWNTHMREHWWKRINMWQ